MKTIQDYILYNKIEENLKTHDYINIINTINNESIYKDIVGYDEIFPENDNKLASVMLIVNKDTKIFTKENLIKRSKKLDRFFDIIEFNNYCYSDYKKDVIEQYIGIVLEPIYSKEVTNEFKMKYHSQAYHFVRDNKAYNTILKCGLRIRCGTLLPNKKLIKYREFPKRIYLYMSYKPLEEEQKEVNEFVQELYRDPNITYKNVNILKVDLSKTNFIIYKDTMMKNKRAVFVYNNIPTKYLKEIKVN